MTNDDELITCQLTDDLEKVCLRKIILTCEDQI
jgi:hypothetical protein